MMGLRRLVVVGLIIPLAAALGLCAVASVWPIRFDHRSLQDIVKLQRAGLEGPNQDFIFLSNDNTIESARTATFGLRPIAFPSGTVFWATLKERSQGIWGSGFVAVDSSGVPYLARGGAPGSWQWEALPDARERVRQKVARARVIYDSVETKNAFESRWPFLQRAGSVTVLSPAESASRAGIWRHPALELSPVRVLRIATLLGVYTTMVLVLLGLIRPPGAVAWLVVAGSVFATLAVIVATEYLLQWVFPGRHWGGAVSWLALLLTASRLARRDHADPVVPPLPGSRSPRLVLVYALVAYAALFLVRLDFDGDFFWNWLPQGRFHYLLGRHEPTALLGYGSMQAASYPPGYGILLSTLMWTADLRPETSFLSGLDTSFAIFVYRVAIFALNAALLVLVAVYLAHLRSDSRGGWVAAVIACLLLIPSMSGRHIAAETVLFPTLAAAIVLAAAGRSLGIHALTTLGLAIGGVATIIKWEGAVLLVLGVLPWVLAPPGVNDRPAIRTWVAWTAVFAASLVPTLLWKTTLTVHNQFFAPVTWSGFLAGAPLLGPLAAKAFQLTLVSGSFVLLLIAVPSAVVSRVAAGRPWDAVLVPFGFMALFLGWVMIFAFSNLEPVTYFENSFDRLVMVPTFSAILYSATAFQLAHRSDE